MGVEDGPGVRDGLGVRDGVGVRDGSTDPVSVGVPAGRVVAVAVGAVGCASLVGAGVTVAVGKPISEDAGDGRPTRKIPNLAFKWKVCTSARPARANDPAWARLSCA